jgi:hypothetical protein
VVRMLTATAATVAQVSIPMLYDPS